VDSAGHLVAFERMMAPYAWATAGIATAKATSAVMFNQSTSDISRWAGDIPGFATSMASMTQGKFIMAPGGWPIRGPNGVTVGAIGISGGNAPGRDDDIARSGVYAAESALQADFQRRAQSQAAAQAPAQPVSAVSPGYQAPAQSQPAPATVELEHSEPAASMYMPVTSVESAQSSAAPAQSQASDADEQPTITTEQPR
jgi:uncharacterized protein GlcG (DUF336 family)